MTQSWERNKCHARACIVTGQPSLQFPVIDTVKGRSFVRTRTTERASPLLESRRWVGCLLPHACDPDPDDSCSSRRPSESPRRPRRRLANDGGGDDDDDDDDGDDEASASSMEAFP
jgi:hypothetical protein